MYLHSVRELLPWMIVMAHGNYGCPYITAICVSFLQSTPMCRTISRKAASLSTRRQGLETANRVDLVWDVYKDDSLKKFLREKRGSGQRRKVLESTKIPKNWKGFLRVDENKN